MTMLKYFTGSPRRQQTEVLTELADTWGDWDVAVVEMPVGAGKSRCAEAVARWASAARGGRAGKSAIVVPNNLLLEQYVSGDGLRGFQQLARKSAYECHEWGTCEARANKIGGHCRSASGSRYARDACPYIRDMGAARSADKLIVNQHIYLAHKLQRQVVCFDEAHTLQGFLQELSSKCLWRSVYKWPRQLANLDQVREWLDSPKCRRDENTEMLRAVLAGSLRGYSVWLGEAELRGAEVECIKLLAMDIRDSQPYLWPAATQKIVLLSATINRLDVDALGLTGRRVRYVSTDSPIPAANRPFIHHPIADLSYRGRLDDGADKLASFLEYELLPAHAGERGLIHAPYALAAELRNLMGDHPRLVWHTREDKREVVKEWLATTGRDDRVLVGSGMHEGLDLAGDRARFQVLTAPPRRSVADPGNMWLAEKHPEQYEWLTIRDIAQCYGRVSRGPEDYGATICVDSSVTRELASPQVPTWLREAFV